jgi:ABC-type multidrug transport system fused ATPase/permease subunit
MVEIWNLFKQGWSSITAKGRHVLWIYGIGLTLLSFMDAYALYVLSLSVLSGETSTINIDGFGESLALVIILFLARSIFATAISYWGVKHFASQEVHLGSVGYSRIGSLSWDQRQLVTAGDLYNSVDRGPSSLIQGVMLSIVTIVTEIVSGFVILTAILFMQPLTAAVALVYFVIVALIQHRILSVASKSAGERVTRSTNSTYQKLSDANSIAKLLAISKSISFEASLNSSRTELANARAASTFLALVPRYFMESVLAVGFLVVAGSTYLVGGTAAATASITVFAAAGFRLLPIVNRIQGLTLSVFSVVPTAKLTFALSEASTFSVSQVTIPPTFDAATGNTLLKLEGVSYSYPTAQSKAIRNIYLELKTGLQYAVVGPSGAGKTTLVDVCLGLLTPQTGKIFRNKCEPWSNLSYVPQDTNLISGSLSSNVAIEWDESSISQVRVSEALEAAQISSLATNELALGNLLGDGATSVSGGQKQRIGLARALYRTPGFLVLDEATSALDSETERAVIESIKSLRDKVTVLIVAHRLSTVRDVDQVIYMQEGEIKGIGTFKELQSSIPQFARQIELGTLGLSD